MTIYDSNRSVLWLLDYDDRLLKALEEIAIDTKAFTRVARFTSPNGAVEALASGGSQVDSEKPRILVSDHVGFERSTKQRQSVAELLRTLSPLSIIVLHSNSAYDDPATIQELRAKRLIDLDVRKTIMAEEFAGLLTKISARWNRPVPARIRDYIRQCPDPALEYFHDYELGNLSLMDIYREIVLGTELGIEQEEVWAPLLNDLPTHAV